MGEEEVERVVCRTASASLLEVRSLAERGLPR